jgi:hypothetical protein
VDAVQGEQHGPVVEPDRVLATYHHIRERWGLKNADTARMKAKRAGWAQVSKNSPSDVTRLIVPREHWDAVGEQSRGTRSDVPREQPRGNGGGISPRAAEDPPGWVAKLLFKLERRDAAELREARELADRRAVELAELRERVVRAEGETAALRDTVAHERAATARERQGREAAEQELAEWTAGGPLARAWRALVYRRG